MPEENTPDGSIDFLDPVSQPEQGVEHPEESTDTEDQEFELEEQPSEQPVEPSYQVPEKFQGKSLEDVIKSYEEAEKALGTYKQKLGDEAYKRQLYESQLQQILQSGYGRNTQNQSSLPGKEAKGNGQDVDLNEKFWDDPTGVIAQLVEQKVNSGVQSYTQQQQAQQQQFLQQRQQEIQTVAASELEVLKTELGGDIPQVIKNQMDFIDRYDPEFAGLDKNPNLTPEMVRENVKKIYDKAVKEIQGYATQTGERVDPETAKAFNEARKNAAANSAPTGRANTSSNQQEDPTIAFLKEKGWGFATPK